MPPSPAESSNQRAQSEAARAARGHTWPGDAAVARRTKPARRPGHAAIAKRAKPARWPGDCVQIWRRAAKSSRWTQRPSDHGQIRRQEAKSGQVDAAFGRAAAYEGSTMAAPLARRTGGEARRRRPQAKLLGRRGRREAREQLVAGDGTSVSATAREEGMVWGIGTA